MNTNVTVTVNTTQRLGWQPQPDGRGSFDIIWSCLCTLFFCTWTVLSLNVPARGTSPWSFTLRKTKWMVIATLGPEWVTGLAGGQWSKAFRSAKKFRSLGHKWTIKHSFFANMGGIRLRLIDDEFPISADMLLGLLKKNAIKFPEITEAMIDDRSKTDMIARLVTTSQIAWFVVQCIARVRVGLGLTSLELSTVAFVVCTLATTILWRPKPRDVYQPVIISEKIRLADLIGCEDTQTWLSSPLQHLDSLRPSISADVVPHLRKFIPWKTKTTDNYQKRDEEKIRFRNDHLPPAERDWYMTSFLAVVSILFGAVYVGGWNVDCPSPVELILWRLTICGMLVLVSAFWILDFGRELYYAALRKQMPPISPFRIAVSAVIAVLYLCCRFYLIIEAFFSLRALPPTAFQTVNWTDLIPHLG